VGWGPSTARFAQDDDLQRKQIPFGNDKQKDKYRDSEPLAQNDD
jgi:hypothetical protein